MKISEKPLAKVLIQRGSRKLQFARFFVFNTLQTQAKACGYQNWTFARVSDNKGFSLIELLVVIVITGILLAIAVPNIREQLSRLDVKDCANKLAADIKNARASAQSEGRRAMLVVTQNGVLQDFVGNGTVVLWHTFLDADADSFFDAGETTLSTSSCASGITIIGGGINTLDPCTDLNWAGIGRCMWFSSIGTLNSGAADRSIVFTHTNNNAYRVRIQVVSLTGYLRLRLCQVSDGVDCTADGNWQDI